MQKVNQDHGRYYWKFVPWVAVVLWMVLIFQLSAQVAGQSNQLSREVTKVVVITAQKVAPEAKFDIRSLNHMVRKHAHFFAYLVFGILVFHALRSSGARGYRGAGLALALCILYATSDEIHQMFVPGRGPGVKDVFIDSAGASVGVGLFWGFFRG